MPEANISVSQRENYTPTTKRNIKQAGELVSGKLLEHCTLNMHQLKSFHFATKHFLPGSLLLKILLPPL